MRHRRQHGYDLATGVGTPNAARLVPALVALARVNHIRGAGIVPELSPWLSRNY